MTKIHSGHVLGIAAFLAPTLGVFAPNMITPVALLSLTGLLILRGRHRESGIRFDRHLVTIISIIVLWSALTLFWTINLSDALLKCASIAALAVLATTALLLTPRFVEHERHALRRFVLAGIGLGFFFFFVEAVSDAAITQNVFGKELVGGPAIGMFNLTPSFLFLFIWPAIGILWRSWPVLGLSLIAMGAVAAVILPSASASIGYISGVIFFLAALLASRGANLFVAVAIAVGIIAAPFVPRIAPALDPATVRSNLDSRNASLLHRLDIWSFTLEKIQERPVLGWGFNASRTVPDGDAHYYLRNRAGEVIGQGNRLPLHPHNGALQVWLELGLPGALAFAALFALAALRCNSQTERPAAAATLAALATAGPIWLLSFGIWQTWWLSALILSTLISVSLIVPDRS